MTKKITVLLISLALLAATLVGCGGADKVAQPKAGEPVKKPTITVGSKEFTEQRIMGNMIAELLKANGYTVNDKIGLGGTMVVAKALQSGDIDVYVEYTGTGLLTVLKHALIPNPDENYNYVKDEYKKQFNLAWLGRIGFNNTYTMSMKADKAKELGISSISDLATKGGDLRFGSGMEFLSRADGLPAISKVYGYNPKKENTKAMDLGLVYQAIDAGQVDIIQATSTDARILKFGLVNLKDDKNFFPAYDAAPVVRQQVLDKNPEIADILNKLTGKISDKAMQELNSKVDIDKKDPNQVAKDFLVSKGLIK